MCKRIAILSVFCASLCVGGFAAADVLRLDTGETLSGRFTRLTDGRVVFQSALAGSIIVPVANVRSLDTTTDMLFAFRNGESAVGRLVASAEGPYFVCRRAGASRPLNLAEIVEASNVPPGYEAPPRNPADSGDDIQVEWDTGVRARFANDDYLRPFTRLALRREHSRYRLDARLMLEYADRGEFPDYYDTDVEMSLAPDAGYYPQIALGLRRNLDSGLERGTDLTIGIGRTLYRRGAASLEGAVGLGVAIEEYDGAEVDAFPRKLISDRRRDYFSDGLERDEWDLNLRMNLAGARQFLANGELRGDLTLYPSLRQLGNMRARTRSAILFPLTTGLRLKLDLQIDYESDPEFTGLDKWSTAIGASLMWDF